MAMTGSRPAAAQDALDVLVQRAAQGDGEAFARVVRLHNEAMSRIAFVILGDPDAAACATEAAWLDAWRRLRGKPTSVALDLWLSSLAAAEAVDMARRRDAPDTMAPAQPARPEARAATPPVDGELVGVIARLDPEDRAVLALRHVAGLSMAEVGQTVSRSRPPVEVRLARLADELGGLVPAGSDPAELDGPLGQRLRAYAHGPLFLVDADVTARKARAEASLERTRVVSVAISAVVGVLLMAHPYLAGLLFGQ
jgi:RNA polymerase sigma-70 factor (ECF subfamily)